MDYPLTTSAFFSNQTFTDRKQYFGTPLEQNLDYRASRIIFLYIPPFIIFIGTLGNIISFVILRISMNKISTYFYLAILALADLLVLNFGLLRMWVGKLVDYDIRDENAAVCKIVVTLGYVCSDFSVWLIVAVTVERYIAVCHPLKASVLCSVKRARQITAGLFLLAVTLNSHFLWTVSLKYRQVKNSTEVISKCEALPAYRYLIEQIWPWVDAALYSLLPSALLINLNILIIRQVYTARHLRRGMQTPCFRGNRKPNGRGYNECGLKLTSMLLVVSFSFILTTLPNNIGLIIVRVFSEKSTNAEVARLLLATTITEMMMYLNHSINFFLYCATGRKFRHSLNRIACKLRHRMRSDRRRGNSLLLTRVTMANTQSKHSVQSASNINLTKDGCEKTKTYL